MKLKNITIAALVAFGALASTAQAAPAMGTGAVSLLGISGAPAGSIGAGTTFSFAASFWSSGTGDFAGIPVATFLTTSSITATTGSAVSFTSAFGDFSGLVDGAVDVSGPPTARIVGLYALGTFSPLGPLLAGFTPGPMSLTFSATQTGAGAAISASYSIASPPAPRNLVPEPGALALVGVALAGLGLMRRKSVAA